MGTGLRFFIVKQDDTFERWSEARFNRVWQGNEPVSEFAGRRLRYALVVLDTKARKPVRVRHAEWSIMTLDAAGRHDLVGARRDVAAVVSATVAPYRRPIADARRTFYERKAHWEPKAPLQAAILEAALKEGAGHRSRKPVIV